MSKNESVEHLIVLLCDAGVEFIVVGGVAGVLQGAPVLTRDLDIVHRRTPDNIRRLLSVLEGVHACFRPDPRNRRLKPTSDMLSEKGHLTLATRLGPFDVLGELENGQGYEELLEDTETVADGTSRFRVLSLPKLIEIKQKSRRAKDRMMLPLLIATLEEREKKQ